MYLMGRISIIPSLAKQQSYGFLLKKVINFAADFYFGSAPAFCAGLVLDRPRENSDVLPTALRNFRPYFSWINPSGVEFIFHLQAEIFIPRKKEKLFNSLPLFKEL